MPTFSKDHCCSCLHCIDPLVPASGHDLFCKQHMPYEHVDIKPNISNQFSHLRRIKFNERVVIKGEGYFHGFFPGQYGVLVVVEKLDGQVVTCAAGGITFTDRNEHV